MILLVATAELTAQPEEPPGKTWQIVADLSDEFNEDTLDKSKWLDSHPYWKGREPSQFNPDNVFLNDGCLCMKSTVINENQEGNWIASACVSSKTRLMLPGYYSEGRSFPLALRCAFS